MALGRSFACLVLILCFGTLGDATPPAPASAPLTGVGRLAGIYDTILQARFDDANQGLSKACQPAPAEACRALRAVVLWWQTLIDPDSRALDDRLRQEAKASIEAAEAWTEREPRNAEAWFYLAGSYAPLAQLQALRVERVAAARSGLRIKSALDRALRLDPHLSDAQFGIGMYHYWADVAPVAAKLLRMLLLLPGGDREGGLREMLQARERVALLSGEADFQLHWIYLWFEKKPAEALRLVKSLDTRYPTNPIFLERVAEIECEFRHDHAASAAAWEALLLRAQRKQVEMASLAEVRARLGMARELLELSQPERAIEVLNVVIHARAIAPYAAQSIAHVHLGDAYDRLGKRDLAVAAYDNAIALMPANARADIRTRARDGLRKRARG
jgi:tetratricopeptide (TPR) repeat protein